MTDETAPSEMIPLEAKAPEMTNLGPPPFCAFCMSPDSISRPLVTGPHIRICFSCVQACAQAVRNTGVTI